MKGEKRIGVIGATSFVGERLCSYLKAEGYTVFAFSRQGGEGLLPLESVERQPPLSLENWVYLAPIWTIPDYFQFLADHGAQRIVALSSTSRFTKISSSSAADRTLAARLIKGEEQLMIWAERRACGAIILQPTLIYGLGKDKNVAAIANFIRRFGFFPLLGRALGRRRPIHVDDVVSACHAALLLPGKERKSYVLSGGESVPYRQMVERIFAALGRRPRFVRCPLFLFSLAIRLAALVPTGKGLNAEMAVRMNKDQDFDHSAASLELGFRPREFFPQPGDLGL